MSEVIWKIKLFEELSPSEVYQILKIRQEVFVVEQACFYLDADGYDCEALHLWGEKAGEIVAYCRVFAPGIKYNEASIGRVLTHPSHRKLNFGKTLMKFAIQSVQARFLTDAITISAQDYLLKFYKDLGFAATSKKYLEDDIPHTEMKRN